MVKRLLVKKREEVIPELSQNIPANGIITVGNDSSATIELPDETIAPEQFVIVCEGDSLTLMCRVDGTRVNGEVLLQGALHDLETGDVISIGDFTLTAETEQLNGRNKKSPKSAPAAPLDEVALSLFDDSAPSETPAAAPPPTEKLERSLTDVLEGLRAEEKFYFLIKDPQGGNRRVYVETEELWIGWAESGDCVIAPVEIDVPRARIRKDWSGVVIYPLQNGNVWLNEETLAEPRRLKNDDKLFLLSKDTAKLNLETVIKFHEPTALLILDSILPKELPPPVVIDSSANDPGDRELDEADLIHSSKIPPVTTKKTSRGRIFGYFSVFEIIIMAIGTLITAAVIFLILEWY